MQKPISLIIEETKKNLAQVINDSELPIYVLLPMLKDLYAEAQSLYSQFALKEQQEYKNALADSKADK